MKVYVSLGKFNKKIFTKNFLYKIFYTEKIIHIIVCEDQQRITLRY